jgi:hypothetical protein
VNNRYSILFSFFAQKQCYLFLGQLWVVLQLSGCITETFMFPAPPASYKDSKNILKLESDKGVKISARYLPNRQAKFTVLYSHGNAEDLGHVFPFLRQYQKRGFALFAYDYRGYGTSQGKASEVNTYKDIEAAYSYLTVQLKIDPNQIIVHGRSVGSGPSTHIAASKPVAGLILESAFTSAFGVVTENPSVASIDPFRNLNKLPSVGCPVLIIHGKADQVVSFQHGKELFKMAKKPKMNYWVEKAGHNNLIRVAGSGYWNSLTKFTVILDKE